MAHKCVNHYGITVDPSKPITGVISNNLVSLFISEAMTRGFDLGYVEAENEFKQSFQKAHHGALPTPEEIAEWDAEYESVDGSDYLIGSWKPRNKFGYFEVDREKGEYAAIVRESEVQVIWSKYVTKCANLCSPCYPGQADVRGGLDDPRGKFLAFNLPPSAYGNINYWICPDCNLELSPIKIEGSVYSYECKRCGKQHSHNEERPEFPYGEFDNGKHWKGED